MLREIANDFYMNQNYNCGECILRAANKAYAEISTTLDIYTHITEDTLKNSVQNMSAKIKLFG